MSGRALAAAGWSARSHAAADREIDAAELRALVVLAVVAAQAAEVPKGILLVTVHEEWETLAERQRKAAAAVSVGKRRPAKKGGGR